MPNSLYRHSAVIARRRWKTRVYPGLLLAGASVIVTCLGVPQPIFSQSEHKAQTQSEGNLLPASIGEPLTVKPLDMQDIDCIVAQWRPSAKMPVLTLICPPSAVFSPLRVLIKLSWMKPEDALVSPEHILAPVGAPTKIRTNKTAALIWLQVDEKGKREPRGTWIGFNAVVDVALLSGRPK
jgi:hypothetical protein